MESQAYRDNLPADIAARGQDHNVQVFLSFDGTQQGGYLPIGVQHTLWQFRDYDYWYSGIVMNFIEMMYSPGIRQLLIYNLFSTQMDAEDEGEIRRLKDPLKDEFYQDLMDLGDYPSNLTLAAVVNGSPTGIDQYRYSGGSTTLLNPGDKTLVTTYTNGFLGLGGKFV